MLIFLFSLAGPASWICVAAASEEMLIKQVNPGSNVTLPCTTVTTPGVKYHAVRWYKETGSPRLTGLASRTFPTGIMRWYVGADSRIFLEEDTWALQLPPVNCSDGGIYQCYLAAPVGEYNRLGRVRLQVTGCPTEEPSEPEPEPETPRILKHMETIPVQRRPSESYLVLCGAIGVVSAFTVFIVLFLCCRCLRRSFWTQTKTPGKELDRDPNSVPEKQDLLWIYTLGLPPKKSEITVA